jgi:hypothetical protein
MDNIEIDLGEIDWGGVDWIGLAQDTDKWRAFVNAVMNDRVRKVSRKLVHPLHRASRPSPGRGLSIFSSAHVRKDSC